eukprot:7258726-Alexandrium_andersonii.AAC.1
MARGTSTRFAPRLPLRRRPTASPSSIGAGDQPWAPTPRTTTRRPRGGGQGWSGLSLIHI